ncbi:MAG: hypothetical protein RXQ75_05380 [Acidianus hospitalis]
MPKEVREKIGLKPEKKWKYSR